METCGAKATMKKVVIRLTTLAAGLAALGGCYSTTSIAGDTRTDPGVDTAADPPIDGGIDVSPPPDAVADVVVDGTSVCPEPAGVVAEWVFDGTAMDEGLDLDVPCEVTAVFEDETGDYSYAEFECGYGLVETHWIELNGDPHVWTGLYVGEEIHLRYVSHPEWWINRWFVIRDAWGRLRLAGVDADTLTPYFDEDWYEPVFVRPHGGFCEPIEDTTGCGTYERMAVEVGPWDSRTVVFDGNYGYAGFMETVLVQVERAIEYREMWCEDYPMAWYKALFVFHMEG